MVWMSKASQHFGFFKPSKKNPTLSKPSDFMSIITISLVHRVHVHHLSVRNGMSCLLYVQPPRCPGITSCSSFLLYVVVGWQAVTFLGLVWKARENKQDHFRPSTSQLIRSSLWVGFFLLENVNSLKKSLVGTTSFDETWLGNVFPVQDGI